MTLEDVWAELGIAETNDRTVVRRAYAARLKVTHPEDDPEGFKRLRAAYDVGLAWAEGRVVVHDAAPAPPEAAPLEAAPAEAVPPPEPASPQAEAFGTGDAEPPVQAPPPATPDPVAEHWVRCRALIDSVAANAPRDALLAGLKALLAAPIMDNLEVFQQTGLGLARALVDLGLKADPLAPVVVRHFGWGNDSRGWSAAPEVQALQALAHNAAGREATRGSEAYDLLTAAPPPRLTAPLRRRGGDVLSLLRRSESKDEAWLAAEFHPETVAWWRKQARRVGKPPMTFGRAVLLGLAGFIGLLLLMRAAGLISDTTPPVPERPPAAASAAHPDGADYAAYADAHPLDIMAWADLCTVTARGYWRTSSLADCDTAAKLRPRSVDTGLDRGFLYMKVGRGAASEAAFDHVLDLEPKNAKALYGRSLAHSLQDEVRAGRKDFCKAVAIDPQVGAKMGALYDFKVSGGYEAC